MESEQSMTPESAAMEAQTPEALRSLEYNLIPSKTIDTGSEHPNSWWIELTDGKSAVEGKLHLAADGLEKIAVYTPGLPGDSVQRFEKDFVPSLTDAGYSVFVIRHTGTRTDSQEASTMVNSELRRQQQNPVGLSEPSETVSSERMINEPRIALNVFGDSENVSEISLISHSFGSLATGVSLGEYLEERPSDSAKIKKWVSVAGMTGRMSEEGVIDGDRGFSLDGDVAKLVYQESLPPEKYRAEEFESAIEGLKNGYHRLEKSAEHLKTVSVIAVNNPEDPGVSLATARDLLDMAGKGILLKDETITSEEAKGKGLSSVHNMPNADPINLVRILGLSSPQSIKEFRLKDKGKE